VNKYCFILASIVGIGFTAVVTLSLNVPSSPVLVAAFVFLTPGGIIASPRGSLGWGPVISVLAIDAIVYSAIAFATLRYWLRPEKHLMRSLVLILGPPATVLGCLACVPKLSPVWPRGMDKLADEERSIRAGLPIGVGSNSARAFLMASGLDSSEQEIGRESLVFQAGKIGLTAQPAERAMWAKSHVIAEQFPCSFAIQVALVFGKDEKLRDKYVGRTGICP